MSPDRRSARPQSVLFFAYHRLHVFVYRKLFGELRARGLEPICTIFDEHIANGQVEPDLVAAIEDECEVRILEKKLHERILPRLLPWASTAWSRDERWGRRGRRLIRELGDSIESVVVPLHGGGRCIGRKAKRRLVALQYEPFIQYDKAKVIAQLRADLFCTWGENDSAALRRAGVTGPIYRAGSPMVELAPRFVFPRLEPRRPLRILYTTTPLLRKRRLDFAVRLPFTMDDYRDMKLSAVRDLHALVREHPQVSVAIKLHPMDEGRVERDYVAEAGEPALSVVEHQPAVSIQDHIAASDMVVTLGSTTAFQAISAGVPVVFLNYGSWTGKHEMGYLAYTFGLAATESRSLLWAFRKTLGDPETQSLLDAERLRYLHRVIEADGQEAIDRMCDALLGRVDPDAPGAQTTGSPGLREHQ